MKKRPAFTLVELLVVIGVIAILVAMLLPALSRAREQANRIACASQQKQIYNALLMYAQEHKGWFPRGTWGTPVTMGGGAFMNNALGGVETALKLHRCPSLVNEGYLETPFYSETGTYGVYPDCYYSTYLYVGGYGYLDETLNPPRVQTDGLWWNGWAHYSLDPFFSQYFDTRNGLGPVPKLNSRGRASDVGILSDRMWPTPADGDTRKWADPVGFIYPSHRNGRDRTEGGNVTFVDGHTEWRAADQIQPRVRAWYMPYFMY